MRVRSLIVCLSMLLALAYCLPGRAEAHAHLVSADLAPDGHVLVGAGTYRFWFDEALNQALSKIVIRDAQGRQVNADTGRVNPSNAVEMDVALPALPDGQYTVFWTSDSQQDGHILHGFYVFTAGGPGATAPSAAPAAIAAPDSPTLDSTALAVALAHWLVLVASTIWAGALALEMLVLAPARRSQATGVGAAAGSQRDAVAVSASGGAARVARIALLATLIASLLELAAQVYAAGGWGGLASETIVADILNSKYGTYWVARMLIAFFALLVLGGALGRGFGLAARPRALGRITAWAATVCALAYLLALALSGHAAAVPELVVTSVVLDWLHLVATAVWIGGMAAIALLLVPPLLRAPSGDAAQPDARVETLDLLDRYSPAAFLALIAAGATGMFNAQVHLGSLGQLIDTAYGRFLLIKLALIAEVALLSASHVFISRPLLRRQQNPVAVQEGYASLAVRLRVEPLVGMLILLCVALMGQVSPSITLFNRQTQTSAAAPVTTQPVPTSVSPIIGVGTNGTLTVGLQVSSPAIGPSRFLVTVRDGGKPVTGGDGQVRIRLSMPGNAALGRTYVETAAVRGGYSGSGDLVQEGPWEAGVLVRTRSDPQEYREVRLTFLVGAGARFITVAPIDHRYGPATVTLTQPATAPDVLTVTLKPGLTVQFLLTMPDMPGMGSGNYAATPRGAAYSSMVNFPMAGITNVAIQVKQAGVWHLVRLLIYNVDQNGIAHLLTT